MEKKRSFLNYIIFLLVVIILLSCTMAGLFVLRYHREEEAYEKIKESAKTVTKTGEMAFDFEFLKEYSKNHVCSWITIPGTRIDYPLVHADDNDYYLTHDAFGNESTSGAIFLNCHNSVSLDDAKTIIFGHSMKNGSMFHDLHKYADKDFGEAHKTLTIYMTDQSQLHYHLLCEMQTNAGNEGVYGIYDNMPRKELASFLSSISDICYEKPIDTDVLILSTCIKGDQRRVVIFQKDKI